MGGRKHWKPFFLQGLSPTPLPALPGEGTSTAIGLPWQPLPGEWTFRKEPIYIQTPAADCILEMHHPEQTTGLFIKVIWLQALTFVFTTKERKIKKSCFFQSFVPSSLSIRVCLLHRDFTIIGFFDRYFYCFSFERRRWLKIKWVVHLIVAPALRKGYSFFGFFDAMLTMPFLP